MTVGKNLAVHVLELSLDPAVPLVERDALALALLVQFGGAQIEHELTVDLFELHFQAKHRQAEVLLFGGALHWDRLVGLLIFSLLNNCYHRVFG